MAALSFPSDNQTGSRDSFLSDSEKAAGISPVAFYAVGECIGMSVRLQTLFAVGANQKIRRSVKMGVQHS